MEAFKMENGKWAYNFSYEGKRYRKQGMKTKKEAEARIKKILSDVASGIDADSNVLFDEYFERWLEINKLSSVDEKSYKRFMSTLKKVRNHFPPDTRLKDLTQMNYQEFINEYAEGLTKNSVSKIHQPIKAALDDAVYNGLIIRNPAYKAHIFGKVPEKDEKYKYMKLDHYIRMKELLKERKSKSGLLLFIALVTGGRFSEVNTIKRVYLNEFRNTIYLNGTKTDTSKRTMSVAPSDMRHIMDMIDLLGLQDEEYILKLSYNSAEKTFKKLKKEIGIHDKITMHALRHTHCSYLYNNGVSIYYISKRLGHKSIRVTWDTYSHLFEEKYELDDQMAVDIMEEMPSFEAVAS